MTEPEAVQSERHSGGTTVHTTGDSNSVAPPPFLDQAAIDHNLKFILGNWPKSAPMKVEEREAWLDVLCQLRQGELRAALVTRADNQSYRPDPYAVLELVLAIRHPPIPAEKRYNTPDTAAVRKLAHEERDPSKFDPREIPSIVHARTMLGKAPDAFKARVEEHKTKGKAL